MMTLLLLTLTLFARQESDHTFQDESTGEVTLSCNFSRLVEHSRPTKWHVLSDMVVYRGRLIASGCYDFDTPWQLKPWAYSNGAQILEYLPERDEWAILRETDESMILNVRVVGDFVMIPEFFPLNEKSRLVHTFDGKTWDHLGLLPQQNWHVIDVIRIGKTLYVSGAWRDLDPKAQKEDPNWWPGYGRVFDSKDDGKTWREIRRTKENGRVLDMVEFQGKLYANERGMHLIAWDGEKWEEIPVKLDVKQKVDAKLGNARLWVFADKIVAINTDLVYTFDGKKWASQTPGYVDLWREGKKLYGLRDTGHVYVTEDAVKWTLVTREGVAPKELGRQAERGYPLHRGSLAIHRGRLFVGTSSEGRVFASPYFEKGKFVSKPVERDVKDGLTISWEAVVPKGTSLHLRVRTASAEDKLEKSAWRDLPETSPATLVPSKDRWVQYRADFESDGHKTPVLKSVRLTSGKE